MTRYGLIGCGRIGQRIAARLAGPDAPVLGAVLVRPAQAALWAPDLGAPDPCAPDLGAPDLVCTTLDAFLDRKPDVVVECASAAALAQWGPDILAAGIDLIPLSLAAFAEPEVEQRLRQAADAGPGRIELAAGAMAGLDFLATAREDRLRRVVFRAAYPPARWIGTPAESRIDLAQVTRPVAFFHGSVRQAARLFPRHLNLCVGVALAGLGLDATEAELFADPALQQARFEVEAVADAGTLVLHVGPRDVPAGADPVDHTTFSVMHRLRRRSARIAI